MYKSEIPLFLQGDQLKPNRYHSLVKVPEITQDLPMQLTRNDNIYAYYGTDTTYLKITPTTLYPYKGEPYIAQEGGDQVFCVIDPKILCKDDIPVDAKICIVDTCYQYPTTKGQPTVTPLCFNRFKQQSGQYELSIFVLWNYQIVSLPLKYAHGLIKLQDNNFRLECILETIDISADIYKNCKGF